MTCDCGWLLPCILLTCDCDYEFEVMSVNLISNQEYAPGVDFSCESEISELDVNDFGYEVNLEVGGSFCSIHDDSNIVSRYNAEVPN